ncbi:breast carcinoma-amplified sequence 4 isoform 2-T2 [Leptodactylus fuscus]
MQASGRAGQQGAQDLELSIEEMLIRLDEFCAMMDMIRSETSLILDDRIAAVKLRVEKMNKIYCQVDKLEAFVKMVGHHVSYLEEELIQAENDHFPNTLNRILERAHLPVFLRKNSKPHSAYELPVLYRTEDYFPASCKYQRETNLKSASQHGQLSREEKMSSPNSPVSGQQ